MQLNSLSNSSCFRTLRQYAVVLRKSRHDFVATHPRPGEHKSTCCRIHRAGLGVDEGTLQPCFTLILDRFRAVTTWHVDGRK